jgi:hypothetical protein
VRVPRSRRTGPGASEGSTLLRGTGPGAIEVPRRPGVSIRARVRVPLSPGVPVRVRVGLAQSSAAQQFRTRGGPVRRRRGPVGQARLRRAGRYTFLAVLLMRPIRLAVLQRSRFGHLSTVRMPPAPPCLDHVANPVPERKHTSVRRLCGYGWWWWGWSAGAFVACCGCGWWWWWWWWWWVWSAGAFVAPVVDAGGGGGGGVWSAGAFVVCGWGGEVGLVRGELSLLWMQVVVVGLVRGSVRRLVVGVRLRRKAVGLVRRTGRLTFYQGRGRLGRMECNPGVRPVRVLRRRRAPWVRRLQPWLARADVRRPWSPSPAADRRKRQVGAGRRFLGSEVRRLV